MGRELCKINKMNLTTIENEYLEGYVMGVLDIKGVFTSDRDNPIIKIKLNQNNKHIAQKLDRYFGRVECNYDTPEINYRISKKEILKNIFLIEDKLNKNINYIKWRNKFSKMFEPYLLFI